MRNFLSLALFVSVSAQGATVKSYFRNREGVKKFEEKNYFQAYQSFLRALEEDPLDPELQMNLGRTFEANEEFEKAEAAYRGALKILPAKSERQFQALFNLAGVQGKEGKIEDALASYQQALEIDPESKEVKTNIELLWQGGGQGKGQGQDKNQQDKDKKGDGEGQDKKNQPKDYQDQKDQKKPKPFKSQELTSEDVKKILDEIKNQEQSIRAQEYDRNPKDAPRAKDW